MELRLVRDVCNPGCTLGQLYVDGQLECYTVEDVVRRDGKKVFGSTAIPAGRYKVIVAPSAHFKRDLPLLLDVPNFEGIRIHPGNTAADTEGCILPGRQRTANGVQESRVAFDALFAKLKAALAQDGEVWIEVVTPVEDMLH